jgi:class 3 adenylate cyclase/predicted ATPase
MASEAERRQLTVMFCDLVGSTQLSTQLDPEDYRAIVQQYQQTCTEVNQRHEGYLAQYLGDGLLVYFGYPVAHEDDARRAVRTGLEIVEAIKGQAGRHTLPVRIGIHTGLVVVGEIGTRDKRELLALGETPNIAARIQGLAEPNTVIISAATHHLIDGQFESQLFGSHLLKGIDSPIAVYHVQRERQTDGVLGGKASLTPLVGREQEVGLLLDRWEQAKEGRGQVVLLSGEPGIGKSRLAYTLREHVKAEGSLLFEARCSPYHQHSALYPLIEVLQRTLLLTRQDTDEEKVEKVERALTLYNLQEAVPLFTALLSLPTPAQYPPLNLTPQKQKERTLQALLQLLMAQAERQATVSVWEDVHWADPSSLEFLSLFIEQIPTTKLLLVPTFRPEFTPPWKPRSHISHLVLNRLGQKHVEAMIEKVAKGRALSAEVIEQIRIKTDGVPLFVEEVTKSVVEAATGVGARHAAPLQTIPATLQEALLARLDRLSGVRQVAQLGATLGREFSYELLHAVSPMSEADLHTALGKLVEAEILYQRGIAQQARYFFKHALIQDTAYQSLLKSTRQQYHRQIAQVLEERFPEAKRNQPELVAHHYTEANFMEQAIPYWQQAGQRATQRSANMEAIAHLTKGLEVIKALPNTSERVRQELALQVALGAPLIASTGYASPAIERVYARARVLCQQIGETPELFPVLWGLWVLYLMRAEHQTALELAEQLFGLAQRVQDAALVVEACQALGHTRYVLGDFASARELVERGSALYDPHQHRLLAFRHGQDPGMICRCLAAFALWMLGYPDQAFTKIQEALTLTRELFHPYTLAVVLFGTALLHQLRREWHATQQMAEAVISLSNEQGFPFTLAIGTIFRGWALAEQGEGKEGIAAIRQGLAAYQVTGTELLQPYFRALLAAAYGNVGQPENGLNVLAEPLEAVGRTGEHSDEAELYRLKGELTLQAQVQGSKSQGEEEAEACFHTAIDIAQKQQAKSLELRAVMSLARLWRQQGKKEKARQRLGEIYGWFTEGFDTKDLQEAKALLEELSLSR